MTRLLVTTGDSNGIGLEVTRKAINSIRLPATVQLIVVVQNSPRSKVEWKKIRPHHCLAADSWAQLAAGALPPDRVLILPSTLHEAMWFDHAIDLAQRNCIDGIVTGPLSKLSFKKAGLAVMGHTGLLAERTRRSVFQGYSGNDLNVVLVTDHIPVSEIEQTLSRSRVMAALRAAAELRQSLSPRKRRLPIAIVGLNPHAGEQGQIGSFEDKLRTWLPRQVIGPLSPDAAFSTEARKKYSVIIALYHDQGLIPFKMLHGQDSGFQVSLGIPFVRTSVDHGTAVDIAGKNRANPGSMASAILGAVSLFKNRSQFKPRI